MRRLFSVAFLALVLVAPAALAAGSGTKVGVINVQQVLANSKAGKEVMQQVQSFGKQLQAEMSGKQEKLKKEEQDLQKNARIESKAQQKKAQQAFQAKVQAFQQDAQRARKSFQIKRASLMVPLQAKLQDVVNAYAKRHGYDLILDSQAAIYNVPEVDVTKAVLKAFNKAQPHAPPPNTSAAAQALGGSGP